MNVKILLATLGLTLVIIVGALLLSGRNQPVNPQSLGKATMTIDKLEVDLGQMKVDEEKSALFTINNSGNSSLYLYNVATSCDCTFATLTINNKETPEFNMSMHMPQSLQNWLGEVPSGQKAVLKVIYRPKVMPVTGPVTRSVSFSTNDPKNAKVEVTIKANVL